MFLKCILVQKVGFLKYKSGILHGYKMKMAVYLLYSISEEYNLEIATKKTKVFGFVGADHLRAKIIVNDATLEQVSQFTYLGCSIYLTNFPMMLNPNWQNFYNQ